MARTTFLIVDHDGTRLGALKALRQQWTPGEQIVVRGRPYRISAVVALDQPDASGATAMLIVAEAPAIA